MARHNVTHTELKLNGLYRAGEYRVRDRDSGNKLTCFDGENCRSGRRAILNGWLSKALQCARLTVALRNMSAGRP